MSARTTGAASADDRAPRRSAEHDCKRVRRFDEEHATRILRTLNRTEAQAWANPYRSSVSALRALQRRRRGQSRPRAVVTPLKGTETTAPRQVRGTLRGQP